jgi:hypothetical protein
MRNAITLGVLLVISGCATSLQPHQARVDIVSNPPGAILRTQGVTATAPHSWTWPEVKFRKKSESISATWPSGATTYFQVELVPGASTTYTVQRPAGAAGLEYDLRAAQQRESGPDGALAILTILSTVIDERGKAMKKVADSIPPTVNCTSVKQSDGTVSTQCR